MIGMKKEKIIGTSFLEKQFKACTDGRNHTAEIKVTKPDGLVTYCQFNANPYFDENQELVGYFAMVTDVTRYRNSTAPEPSTT